MKRIYLAVALMAISLGAFATSTPTGGKEKGPVLEGNRSEMAAPAADVRSMGQAEVPQLEAIANEESLTEETPSQARLNGLSNTSRQLEGGQNALVPAVKAKRAKMQRVKADRQKVKRMHMKRDKVKKPRRRHAGGGILGILAIVFGGLGFLLAWVFWPLGILFAITAIILGAIGLGGEKRGLALGGLILGILTIILPVLLVAIILAAL